MHSSENKKLPEQLRAVAQTIRTAGPVVEAEREKRATRIGLNLVNLSTLERMIKNAY